MTLEFNHDIKQCLDTLQSGGVILYPTDTIWGLGCDATNENAVRRIYEMKKRLDTKSMLVLIDSPAKLQAYVEEIPDMAWDLIELTNKPLSIIYPCAKNLAKNLLADDNSIGIRVTNEFFSKTLCMRFKRPIVSTSANISGEPSPLNFSQISDYIKSCVDHIVDYRQTENTSPTPSSIIKLGIGNQIQIIRE